MDGARESADVISDSVRDGEMRKWLAAQQHIIQPFRDLAGADEIKSPELIDVYQEYFLELVRFFLAQGDLVADMRGMVATMKEKGKSSSSLPDPDLAKWENSCATIAAMGCSEDEELNVLLRMVSLDAADLEREYPRRILEGGEKGVRLRWVIRIIGSLMVISLLAACVTYVVDDSAWYYSVYKQLAGVFAWLLSKAQVMLSMIGLDIDFGGITLREAQRTVSNTFSLTTIRDISQTIGNGIATNKTACEIFSSTRVDDIDQERLASNLAAAQSVEAAIMNPGWMSGLNAFLTVGSQHIGRSTFNLMSGLDAVAGLLSKGVNMDCIESSMAHYIALVSSIYTGVKTIKTAEAQAYTSTVMDRQFGVVIELVLVSIYVTVIVKVLMASGRSLRRRAPRTPLERAVAGAMRPATTAATRVKSHISERRGEGSSSYQLTGHDDKSIFSLEIDQYDPMPLRALRTVLRTTMWANDSAKFVAFWSLVPVICTNIIVAQSPSGSTLEQFFTFIVLFPVYIRLIVLHYVYRQAKRFRNYIGTPQTAIGIDTEERLHGTLQYFTLRWERKVLEGLGGATSYTSMAPYMQRYIVRPMIRVHEKIRDYTVDEQKRIKMNDEDIALKLLTDTVNRIRDMATRSPMQTDCLVLSPEGSGNVVQEVCKIVDDIGELLGTEAAGSGVRDAVSSDDPCGDLCKIVGDIEGLLDAI